MWTSRCCFGGVNFGSNSDRLGGSGGLADTRYLIGLKAGPAVLLRQWQVLILHVLFAVSATSTKQA
jgi:hypothetical protein